MNEVTIKEIESGILALRPDLAGDEISLREMALLFAILKCGPKQGALIIFTHYQADLIRRVLIELTDHRVLITGAISPQFILRQLPGCRDLIERITGAAIAARENPMPEKEEGLCKCGKELKHKGRCPGLPLNSRKGETAGKQLVKREARPAVKQGGGRSAPVVVVAEQVLQHSEAKLELEFRQNGNHFHLQVTGAEYIKGALNLANTLFEVVDEK